MIFLIKSISITKKRMEEKETEERLWQLERGSYPKKKKKEKVIMEKTALIFCKFIVYTNYTMISAWSDLFVVCAPEIRDETKLLPHKHKHTNTRALCKQSLRLLMPLHPKNITATWCISEIVPFCCISLRSLHCHCSLPPTLPTPHFPFIL